MEQSRSYQVELLNPADTALARRCFHVFAFLRPHLDEETFIRRLAIQSTRDVIYLNKGSNAGRQGYAIAFVELDGEVSAAAGYRVADFLAWGKVLYIDDLITHPERTRHGLGGALMDWLFTQARAQGCDEVHLDTGFQRHDAHRLYLNKGLTLSCHHMSTTLT